MHGYCENKDDYLSRLLRSERPPSHSRVLQALMSAKYVATVRVVLHIWVPVSGFRLTAVELIEAGLH